MNLTECLQISDELFDAEKTIIVERINELLSLFSKCQQCFCDYKSNKDVFSTAKDLIRFSESYESLAAIVEEDRDYTSLTLESCINLYEVCHRSFSNMLQHIKTSKETFDHLNRLF